MNGLLQDLRFGLRSLRKHIGLTVVAVLSLGLGIGANTTVFTWLQAFIYEPLPSVPGFSRLAAVNTRAPGGDAWSLSYLSVHDWRAAATTMDVAGAGFVQLGLRGEGGGTERAWGVLASGNYFDVLQVRPALGRLLTMQDEEQRARVGVLGYSYWQRRFAGDSAIVGRHLSLNGQDIAIVGVAPPRFGGTIIGLNMDIYLPVTIQPVFGEASSLDDRGWEWMDGFGRLRDGFTLAQARADLDAVAKRVSAATGDGDSRNGAIVKPLNEQGAASFMKPVLLAMLGVTAVVLLIACANVANLLLARALARRREIGIRLIRQLLTESLALAAAAGALGVLVTLWGRDIVMKLVPPAPFPIGMEMTVSGEVMLFALALTLVTSLLFGLMPALQASKPELVPSLKDEIGGGPGQRSRLQSALVVSQVALSLVSLVCAGLFMRSLAAARGLDVGFTEPEKVLLVNTDLTLGGVPDSLQGAVTRRLLAELRAVPGVVAASVSTTVPLGFGGTSSRSVTIEGYAPRPNENMSIQYAEVGDDYFRAMGIGIVQGRGIGAQDVAGAMNVVVVNQRFAERYWPGQDPIGRRLLTHGRWCTVVGVARQGKYQSLDEPARALLYVPYFQDPTTAFAVHVRAAADPKALTAALRGAFRQAGPELPFLDVRTMAEHMQAAVFAERLGAIMLAAFGGVALLLSAIGIYGVLSFGVRQRTREIGVRVALGAARADVIGLVVGRALRLTGLGLLIGLVAALGAGQALRSQLVGVGPRDPLTFTAIALLLGAVALGASWLPARRAAHVDPMIALRSE